MIDITILREHPEIVQADLKKRGLGDTVVDEIRKKDEAWRTLKKQAEDVRHQRNNIAKDVAQRKKAGQLIDALVKQSQELAQSMKIHEEEMAILREEITVLLMSIPNLSHESVPAGNTEEQNRIEQVFGEKPAFSFTPKSHVDLLAEHDWADIDRAGKIAGSRFYFLKGELVMLEKALQMYAIDFMTKRGFTVVDPPYMMSREAYECVINFETFDEMMYKVEDENLYLIATSEHPLTAMYMNEILEPEQLVIKMCGVSTCFRKEAGSHGKDTKGIFRVHHFNKVEQVVLCDPEQSWDIHEELRKNLEDFFTSLDLYCRTVTLCVGEASSVSAKTYDTEVWFPVQNTFREVGSCSNCLGYQARRLKIRVRRKEKNEIIHTLNSTCVSTSRALVAIMENFQNEDGSVNVPQVLQKYMNGKKVIGEKQ